MLGVMKRHLFVLCAVLTAVPVCVAQEGAPSSTDPSLVFLISGGYWEHNGARGAFRVLVRNGGFEHVSSQVSAEWVAEPQEAGQPSRVIFTRGLLNGGLISVGVPVLTPLKNQLRVTLHGVVSTDPDEKVSCEFLLKADGTAVVVKKC